MKEIYLLRHAEKDSSGVLTTGGELEAKKFASDLPSFALVISSDSQRTQRTAFLLTGREPQVEIAAGHYTASPEKSALINDLKKEKGMTFLEAARVINDEEVNQGIRAQALELIDLIDKLFNRMGKDEKVLIVSHDLSISPAMAEKGVPLGSIPYLSGYVIGEDWEIREFRPSS